MNQETEKKYIHDVSESSDRTPREWLRPPRGTLWSHEARSTQPAEHRRSANRSTARETAASGSGCSGRRSVTCAGLGPALAVSRLSRAPRRSHGSLPLPVFRCCGHRSWFNWSRMKTAACLLRARLWAPWQATEG